jgi:hypothetical protein
VNVGWPFGLDILEEYAATLRDPVRVHGICEEYRAAATIDKLGLTSRVQLSAALPHAATPVQQPQH